MGDEARYAFSVAVVGDPDVMEEWHLARLLELLVNRHRDTRRIVILATGTGPEITPWARELGWDVQLVSHSRNACREDCELIAWADAVVVLGDRGPYERLLRLAKEAGIPSRVYATRPKLPPPRTFPAGG